MNPEYKILRMKDLAEKLELKEARSFKRSEAYLEYAIKEINSKSKYYWYQYLFLIDILYVVIVAKSSVKSAYESHPARMSASGMAAPPSYDTLAKAKDSIEKNLSDDGSKMDTDGSDLIEHEGHSKVKRTRLNWSH